MGAVTDKVQLVKEESARIAEYLRKLTPAAWETQSACDAWQVRDVLAHFTLSMDMFGACIARGAAGDAAPPDGSSLAGEGDQAARLAANAQRAVTLREELGEGLLAAYNERRVQFDEVLAGLSDGDKDKPCYHPAGTISVETYLNLRLTELIVHEWDIRSVLEAEPVLSSESLPSIVEMFPVFVVGRLFDPGNGMPASSRFRFETTGGAAGSYDIVAGGGEKARMETASHLRPDVILGCDTQTFVLLVYGRMTLEEATAAGKIVASGNNDLVAQFGS
ncbi:MAG: hypothetical protein CL759_09630 [Chloroflexi bacterium]|nr:hypothetical protein [Chloroflexota bacterium]